MPIQRPGQGRHVSFLNSTKQASDKFMHRTLQTFAQVIENVTRRRRERSVDRTAAGVQVSASAEALRNAGDVEFSLAAQRQPDTPRRELAQKYGERFKPNKLLLDMASKGESFYSRFAPKRQKQAA